MLFDKLLPHEGRWRSVDVLLTRLLKSSASPQAGILALSQMRCLEHFSWEEESDQPSVMLDVDFNGSPRLASVALLGHFNTKPIALMPKTLSSLTLLPHWLMSSRLSLQSLANASSLETLILGFRGNWYSLTVQIDAPVVLPIRSLDVSCGDLDAMQRFFTAVATPSVQNLTASFHGWNETNTFECSQSFSGFLCRSSAPITKLTLDHASHLLLSLSLPLLPLVEELDLILPIGNYQEIFHLITFDSLAPIHKQICPAIKKLNILLENPQEDPQDPLFFKPDYAARLITSRWSLPGSERKFKKFILNIYDMHEYSNAASTGFVHRDVDMFGGDRDIRQCVAEGLHLSVQYARCDHN